MFQKVLDYPNFMMGILDQVSQFDLQQDQVFQSNDESTQERFNFHSGCKHGKRITTVSIYYIF
jgi:hypothetical protein